MQVIIFDCTDPFHRRDVTAISSENRHETCVDGEMFDFSCFLVFFRDPVMKTRDSLEERVEYILKNTKEALLHRNHSHHCTGTATSFCTPKLGTG
jgi:hypothetical protein